MRIPENIVEQIRDSVDIVSIVQDYVRLKKAGHNYIGLCPFHDEKTASFNVSPVKGFFKCFGCGKGGNVITFVMEIERLEFVDAVRWLADREGIEIPVLKSNQGALEKKNIIFSTLRFAAEYYAQKLHEPSAGGSDARKYLDSRGLTAKTIKRFKLGYAPDGWDGLLKAAERRHIEAETLVKAGLVVKREDGKGYYDRFRNRIIFPVWSHVGKIIGFGGRILEDAPNTPKYLNSPETEVYHKSQVLYGLFQSKREARQQERIILVEGYTDVLALDQAGVASVACCGTALTPPQVKLLGRYVSEIRLLYDADRAGMTATERAIDCVLQNGLDASVVLLPEGEDPDSFVRNQGADQFRSYLQSSTKSWMKALYTMAERENLLGSPPDIRRQITKIAERLSWLRDDILEKIYIKEASQLFGLLEGDIIREVNAQFRKRRSSAGTDPVRTDPSPESTPGLDMIMEAEKMLLKLMLDEGAPMIEYILTRMSLEEFQEGPSRDLVDALIEQHQKDEEGSKIQPLHAIQNGQFQVSPMVGGLVSSLVVTLHEVSGGWEEKKIFVPRLNADSKRVAQDCMRHVKKKFTQKQSKELQEKILNASPGSATQLRLQEQYRQARQFLIDLDKPGIFDG